MAKKTTKTKDPFAQPAQKAAAVPDIPKSAADALRAAASETGTYELEPQVKPTDPSPSPSNAMAPLSASQIVEQIKASAAADPAVAQDVALSGGAEAVARAMAPAPPAPLPEPPPGGWPPVPPHLIRMLPIGDVVSDTFERDVDGSGAILVPPDLVEIVAGHGFEIAHRGP